MFTSSMFAPPRTWSTATSAASGYCPPSISRRNRAEPVTLVRSPTTTKPVSAPTTNGSSPLNRGSPSSGDRSGTSRGGRSRTRSAMARTCSGVVPQQPPRTLARPASANSPRMRLVISGISSYPPNAFGSPAFG